MSAARPALDSPDQQQEWSLLQRSLHGLVAAYSRFYQGARWEPSTLPENGPAILACNHVSVLDPLLLVASNHRLISFLVAQEYYDKKWLRPLLDLSHCIPVRRDGRDIQGLRRARQVLMDGHVLGIFPEGGVNRQSVQAGIAWLVKGSGAAVVPARIIGAEQGKSDLRTWLRRQHPLLRYGVPLHFHRDAEAGEVLGAIMSAIATLA